MGSISKKIKSLASNGLKPLEEGMRNYLLNNPIIEDKARKRYELSKNCIVKEPVDFLRIKDKRIPELSEMMAEDCGCAAPFFYRQDIYKLKEWDE